jgi:hypothetical protein
MLPLLANPGSICIIGLDLRGSVVCIESLLDIAKAVIRVRNRNARLSKAVFLSEMRRIIEISRLARVRKEFIKVAPENFAIRGRGGCRYAK